MLCQPFAVPPEAGGYPEQSSESSHEPGTPGWHHPAVSPLPCPRETVAAMISCPIRQAIKNNRHTATAWGLSLQQVMLRWLPGKETNSQAWWGETTASARSRSPVLVCKAPASQWTKNKPPPAAALSSFPGVAGRRARASPPQEAACLLHSLRPGWGGRAVGCGGTPAEG